MLRRWAGSAAVALVVASAGCHMGLPVPLPLPGTPKAEVARLYSGPERLSHEVGIVAVANSQIHVDVLYIDGIRIEGQRVFHLLPGVAVIQVRCVRWQPRDPAGSWKGHEILQANIESGHKYDLRTKTTGPGRTGLRPNRCTSWVEDRNVDTIVSEILYEIE